MKKPLDEGERGEWKSWLKIQYSKNFQDHSMWSHHFMANRGEKVETVDRYFFSWAPKSLQIVTVAMKLKNSCSLEGKL